jgi:uncharacterized protein
MRHERFVALVLLGLLSMASLAMAQGVPASSVGAAAAQQPDIDPKAKAWAAELIKLVDLRSAANALFTNVYKVMVQMAGRTNPEQNAAIKTLAVEACRKAFLAHADEFDDNAIALYARNFSADELQQIVVFYKTPIGKKMVKTMPEMMQKSMAVNMPLLNTMTEEAMDSFAVELKRSGFKVPKEMGK